MTTSRLSTGIRLPRPIGRQKEVLCLPPVGHVVVLGTAGSGKTTLAVHRAFHLADGATEHGGRTLLVTFNRCLVAYLNSLVDGVPDQLDVLHYHRFARGYLQARGRMRHNCICGPDLQKALCRDAVESAKQAGGLFSVVSRPLEVLIEEFHWIAQHGIQSLDEYVDAERIGRAGTRILRAERPTVFGIYERYKALRAGRNKEYDWDDLAQTVLSELRQDLDERRYRHIVVDEGQDFSPTMLRSLAAAIPDQGSLTFLGDMAQQIYGHRISWRSAGLNVSDVWRFEENYRNSRQVAELALTISKMPLFPDDADLVAPRSPTADGPLPALVPFEDEEAETTFVVQQATRAASSGTVAILLRDRSSEDAFARLLPPSTTRLHGDLERWPARPGIFYGTYHAAKGLEFDTVILPRLSSAHLPHPPDVAAFGGIEAAVRDLRLLYVGVTRARSNLVLTHAGLASPLVPLKDGLYQGSH
jgi:superfamily I DNA/RNA helicase